MIILTILKIILIILLIIIGIVVLLLIMPASVYVSYIDGKIYYKVKYAFISIFASDGKSGLINRLKSLKRKKSKPKSESEPKPQPEPEPELKSESEPEFKSEPEPKPESKPKSKLKSKPKSENSDKPKKFKKIKKNNNSNKKSKFEKIPEIWDKITQIWEIASSPVKRMCRGIHFDSIYIAFKISDPDAYDCALKYGRMCALVYNSLAAFDKMFSLTKKSIDVDCIFNQKKSVYDISFTVRCHPIVPLISAVSFAFAYYLKIYNKNSGGKNNGKPKKANK